MNAVNCSFKSFTFEFEVERVTSTSLDDTAQLLIVTVEGVVTEHEVDVSLKDPGNKFLKMNLSSTEGFSVVVPKVRVKTSVDWVLIVSGSICDYTFTNALTRLTIIQSWLRLRSIDSKKETYLHIT